MTETPSSESVVSRPSLVRVALDRAGGVIILVLLLIVSAITVPNFSSSQNLVFSLGLGVVTTGIVACGMLFALASGDFDLSVGSVAAFSGMIVAVAVSKGMGVGPAIALGLLSSLIIGAANGIIIAVFGINALITTLATMQIVRGAAYLLNDGNSLGIANESFSQLGTGSVVGIPLPVWFLVIVLVASGFLLHRTIFGRNTLAIGGNKEAATLAGVPTTGTKIAIFSLLALLSGLAGIISSAQTQLGDPKGMVGLELKAISGCVLGGVSLNGGIGSIQHVVAGVLIIGTVQNVMDLKNVPTFYQYVISGVILLAAVLFDRLKQKTAK